VTIARITDYPAPQQRHASPALSVVTIVHNGEKTLQRTIDSLRAQAIDELEYIIVDAASTDATLQIVYDNTDIVTHWVSEKDRGISDGFSKGIALSSGKYVLLLNADDWLSPDQLAHGIETLEKTGADFVFGDLIYHSESGGETHRIHGEARYAERIAYIMPGLNHPTVIVRRSAYERHGLFDLGYRLAMDYELLLRFHRAGCRGIYDPRMIGHMSLQGVSDRNAGTALKEVRIASIRHGYPPLAAWLRYLGRYFKWRCHLALADKLPRPAYVWLRRQFNRNYVAPT
jgi:glycosyltransferase involved in cell wall biosynthesis